MARPKKEIDEESLRKLAGMGCTMKEMAAFFYVSVDTLENRYSELIAEGREEGKSSVRRMLWLQGEKGNSVALKYLIHNVLKEKLEDPQEQPLLVNQFANLSNEEKLEKAKLAVQLLEERLKK